jgi:RHS repeat-associated protein
LYYHARYYDPTLGRFISPDSIVPGAGALTAAPHDAVAQQAWGQGGGTPTTPQELNRYAYAQNAPLRFTDPTGHCVGVAAGADTLLCAIGGAAAAATAPAWLVPVAIGVGIIALGAGMAYVASAAVAQQADAAPAADEDPAVKSPPKGGTYVLKDPETGSIERTGRTGDLKRRERQHARNPQMKDLDFDVDARTDDYAQQRGREQILHDKYAPPRNKIRPIRLNHPKRDYYLREGDKVQGKY